MKIFRAQDMLSGSKVNAQFKVQIWHKRLCWTPSSTTDYSQTFYLILSWGDKLLGRYIIIAGTLRLCYYENLVPGKSWPRKNMEKRTWTIATATRISILRCSKYWRCQTESGTPNTCSRLSVLYGINREKNLFGSYVGAEFYSGTKNSWNKLLK